MNWQSFSLVRNFSPAAPSRPQSQGTRSLQLDKRRLDLEKKLSRYVQKSPLTPSPDYRILYEEAAAGRKKAEIALKSLQKQLTTCQKLDLRADAMRSDLAEVRELLQIEQNNAKTALGRSHLQSQMHSLQAQGEKEAFYQSDLKKSLLNREEQREDLAKEAEAMRETLIQLKKLHVERTESTKRDIETAEKGKNDLEKQIKSLLVGKSDANSALSLQVKTLLEQLSDLEAKLGLEKELESSLKADKERNQFEIWGKRVLQTQNEIQELSFRLDRSLEQGQRKSKGRRSTQSPRRDGRP